MSSRHPGAARRHDPSSRLLVEIVNHLDAMVAYWTVDQKCVFANAAYRQGSGETAERPGTGRLDDPLAPFHAANRPHLDAALRGEKQVFQREIGLPGGARRSSLATFTPHQVNGQVVGIIVHVVDVTPLKRAQEELRAARERAEKQAAHDPLTGLPNRLLLHESIDRAIAAARRTRECLALMTIDADHFKTVNDGHGHAVGDRLLVELATRLRRSVRAADTVFRVGGDEFIALLPDIGSDSQARALAQRILQAMREPLALPGAAIVATVSIGIAVMPGPGCTADALLMAADRALYEAKGQGRNRVVVSSWHLPRDDGPLTS